MNSVGLKPNEKRGPCEFETSAKAWYIFLQEKTEHKFLFIGIRGLAAWAALRSREIRRDFQYNINNS